MLPVETLQSFMLEICFLMGFEAVVEEILIQSPRLILYE